MDRDIETAKLLVVPETNEENESYQPVETGVNLQETVTEVKIFED